MLDVEGVVRAISPSTASANQSREHLNCGGKLTPTGSLHRRATEQRPGENHRIAAFSALRPSDTPTTQTVATPFLRFCRKRDRSGGTLIRSATANQGHNREGRTRTIFTQRKLI